METSRMSSDNALRTPDSAQGHVESHFLKANSADGTRALWIKFTSLLPQQVGELWAIAFDRRGAEILARKRTFPLRVQRAEAEPFRIELPDGALTEGATQGDLGVLRWQLRYTLGDTFRPFPLAWMYRGAFPRSKSLTPSPDARFDGWFEVAGERWQVDGWRGCQGHNWGTSHAHAYAWVHCNALAESPDGPAIEGAWLEALTGRVRLGPVLLPFMTVAGIRLDGRLHHFAGPRALLRSEIGLDTRSLRLSVRHGGDRLQAELRSTHFAGLRYQDPDGSELACLNSKLAEGRIRFTHRGRERVFYTQQAALEIGTREPGHGVELLA
jgi:hypothetical protein